MKDAMYEIQQALRTQLVLARHLGQRLDERGCAAHDTDQTLVGKLVAVAPHAVGHTAGPSSCWLRVGCRYCRQPLAAADDAAPQHVSAHAQTSQRGGLHYLHDILSRVVLWARRAGEPGRHVLHELADEPAVRQPAVPLLSALARHRRHPRHPRSSMTKRPSCAW